jgi:hypothetical protein
VLGPVLGLAYVTRSLTRTLSLLHEADHFLFSRVFARSACKTSTFRLADFSPRAALRNFIMAEFVRAQIFGTTFEITSRCAGNVPSDEALILSADMPISSPLAWVPLVLSGTCSAFREMG